MQRRDTFDQVALLYDQARPSYPAVLFNDIVRFSRLSSNATLLEIGCGTGQATLPFAERGYSIDALELGVQLGQVAQANLTTFPDVQVIVANFETWDGEPSHYDLIFSATAFHWIAPHLRYIKTASLLQPTGTLALFWNQHVQTEQRQSFFDAVQEVYRRIVPNMAKDYPGLPHPDNVPTPVSNEIQASHLFGEVTTSTYYWQQQYTAQTYTDLLNTYSNYRMLPTELSDQLYHGIRQVIDTDFGGKITMEYLTVLCQARRNTQP